jgi:uncharacterized protein YndB with AHSA1/START domain
LATDQIFIEASRDDVFEVLSDGWRYSNWVVGTSHMYAVQKDWPAAGSKLWHASGAWPLVVRDETEVISVEPARRMELVARGRPFGAAAIVLTLEDEGAGCRVTMEEEPIAGVGRWLNNPVGHAMLHRRNVESLTRLKSLAERRTEPMR